MSRKITDLGGFLTFLSLMAVMAFFFIFGVVTFTVNLIEYISSKIG